jgi:hypothetical protein
MVARRTLNIFKILQRRLVGLHVEVSFAVDRDAVTSPFDFGATERTRSDISPHREQANSRVRQWTSR